MASYKTFLVLFVLGTLALVNGQVVQGGAHIDQGGPHQNQGANGQRTAYVQNPPSWTTCDPTAVTKISCHDCNTRLICKPVGGLLKTCNGSRPYCNNGICSSTPSPDCA